MHSQSIQQVSTTRPDLFAFRIDGEVSRDDMTEMASFMNEKFDTYDKVDMMLIFDKYDGAEAGASLSWEALKSRVKSISNVERYVVVGAPQEAQDMLNAMGKLLPVQAETFDDEEAAWDAMGAQVNLTSTHPGT